MRMNARGNEEQKEMPRQKRIEQKKKKKDKQI